MLYGDSIIDRTRIEPRSMGLEEDKVLETEEERLNREEQGRETAKKKDETLNLPHDVPKPVSTFPSGYGIEGGTALPDEFYSKPIRDDEENPERFDLADLVRCDDENIAGLKAMWKEVYDEECPHDLDDLHDREINYQLALEELKNGWKVDVSKVEGLIEVSFDWRGLGNEATRAFLKRKGDEEFIRKVWGGCTRISLCEPVEEDEAGWKIIIESGSRDRRDFVIISRTDLENSLVTEAGRTIELPRLKQGSMLDRVRFIEALHKLEIGGIEMPPVVNVDVKMGVRFPPRTPK